MRARAASLRQAIALLVVLLAAPLGAAATRSPRATPKAPALPTAAIVMDVKTGAILFERDAHRRWSPASTTKILTAMLVIERLRVDRVVPISPRAAAQRRGSSIGLEQDDVWLVGDLLTAMVVRSANDAAVALAEAAGGSVEEFVRAMNARAKRLGARNTHFTNPHGLHDPDHYTTAYDLALMARYALHHPTFARLASTPAWVLARGDRTPQQYPNTNKFLSLYMGADGVKTGWTAASGPCLVASATRGGWQLVAVVLNSASSHQMYRDAEGLLNNAFRTFRLVRVAEQGKAVTTVDLGRRRSIDAVVPADVYVVVKHATTVTSRVRMRPNLRLPIEAGERLGEVVFLEGTTVVAQSALIAARTLRR